MRFSELGKKKIYRFYHLLHFFAVHSYTKTVLSGVNSMKSPVLLWFSLAVMCCSGVVLVLFGYPFFGLLVVARSIIGFDETDVLLNRQCSCGRYYSDFTH